MSEQAYNNIYAAFKQTAAKYNKKATLIYLGVQHRRLYHLGCLGTQYLLQLLHDLALRGPLAKHQAGNGYRHDHDRGNGEYGEECESRSVDESLALEPVLPRCAQHAEPEAV